MQISFNHGQFYNLQASNSRRTGMNFKGAADKFYNTAREIADDIIRQEGTRRLLSETSDGSFIATSIPGGKKANAEKQANAMSAIVIKIINTIEQQTGKLGFDFRDGKLLKLAVQYAPKNAEDINSRKYACEIMRLMAHTPISDDLQREIETDLARKGLLDGLQFASEKFKTTNCNYLGGAGHKDYLEKYTTGRVLANPKDDY